jgi:hypothetical protein
MPEFQNKVNKFLHRGMNWNAAVDSIPEGQVCFAKNIRVTQQGTITQRPGLQDICELGGTYIHSISRLNNYDPNVNFSRGYVIGMDNQLFFGAAQYAFGTEAAAIAAIYDSLINPSQNPVKLPPSGSLTGLSGNPLTMVDMAPVGSTSGWKYIGDKNLNCAIGFYPGDNPVAPGGTNPGGMARAIPMGLRPPVFAPFLNVATGGLLNGDYQWVTAYRNRWTGARSNPSAPSRENPSPSPAKSLVDEQVSFYLPDSPVDPQTGVPDPNIVVDVYRFGGTIPDWRYVGTADGGAIFSDNLPDTSILTAPGPPQLTDNVTNVTRFNLLQPFVTQDIARFNSPGNLGTVSLSFHGTFLLNATGGDTFKLGILPGSAISINNKIFSVYQVISATQLEIYEDATGSLTNGANVPWAVQAGTLVAGNPLPHIWGPYGTGQGGAFIFGVGDVNNAGTLFWCNGNDPDSTDLVNSLIVTSPSEPLRGGCVYDGTPFCWSTERMFRIYPGTTAGQFTVQEVPGSKGLWAEYSLTVQSNGVSDQSISWVGKDGIYDWSNSGGLRTLTDRDLYPFFPHDNQPGLALSTIFPFLVETVPIGSLNFDADSIKYHRLTWFHNELFYDFKDTGGNYHALVYDAKESGGWVSLDQYLGGFGTVSGKPMTRCNEIAANNMKLGLGSEFLDYAGTQDSSHTIPCRFTTRADDLGDSRVLKLYGDYTIDAATNGAGVSCTTWLNNFTNKQATGSVTNSVRTQGIINLGSGLGVLGRNHGLDFTWDATAIVTLYEYSYSYVPKPPRTNLRATDKTDDGYQGAKYLRGLSIESNTTGPRTVEVLVDDQPVGSITVNTGGSQLELPFAITPVVGAEFQIQPTDANEWEVFTVRWVWEKWPDLTTLQSNWMDLGTAKPKYIRSFTIPVSGSGAALTFTAIYDNTLYATTSASTIGPATKSTMQFSFNPPILAHQIKLGPSAPCRCWYDQIVWDAEEWPELATMYGPVEKLGDSGAKYLRGLELPIETNGQPVVMSLKVDTQNGNTGSSNTVNFQPLTTDPLVKNVFALTPLTPIIAHEFQLISKSPARFWYGEVKWDYEPWPEFDTGVSPWLNNGTVGAKFIRGITIPVDTGGQPVTFDLLSDTGTSVSFGPFTTTAGYKTSIYCGFAVPLIIHQFQLQPRTPCRVWDQEIKWDAEAWPESEVESSAWIDGGNISAKFTRGITIAIDTNNSPVTFDLYTDTGVSLSFGPFSTQTGSKTAVYCGFPVPLILHEFRIQPRGPCRCWYEEIKWDMDLWPELEVESSGWLDGGSVSAKYIRGITIPIDTGGNPVMLDITTDTGQVIAFGPFTTGLSVKTSVYCGLAVPLMIHQFRIQPRSACRCWYGEIKWDADPWPEYEVESSGWLDNGTPSAKFIRGITIPVETNGLPVMFDIYTDTGEVVSFGPFTTAVNVKTSVYCGFPVPLIIHQFRIQPRTNARCWYGEIKWDADPWPENEAMSSSWSDAGYQGAKFLQGVVLPLDTAGTPVTFDVIYDGGSTTIGPFTTVAGQKTTVAYSFPVPFICHNLLLTPRSACRVFYDEVKWIWEPVPELVTTYTTQETNLDLPGYHYQFDAYIAYIGSADAPVLHIKTEYGTVDYTLPVSNGVFIRAYLMLKPQKAKWRSFSVTSTGGIRLFLKDCEIRAKPWTDKGNYPSAFQVHRPMGAESRVIGARI